MKISYWFLVFYILSVLGYVSEIVYCYILNKKIVNRGFLYGPYCPIYGIGGLFTIIILRKYYNYPLLVFFIGMIICSVIEYIASFLLEKLFNNKLWDYSNYKYNLNGRVCLKNSILFGIGSISVIYLIYPLLNKFIYKYSIFALNIITIILFFLFIIDIIFSILDTLKLKKQLNIIDKFRNEIENNIADILQSKINESLSKYKRYPKHIINAFSNISNIHRENINYLKEKFKK